MGNRNIVGAKVAQVRKEKGINQKDLVAALQSRASERLQQKLISLLSLIPAEFLELFE